MTAKKSSQDNKDYVNEDDESDKNDISFEEKMTGYLKNQISKMNPILR